MGIFNRSKKNYSTSVIVWFIGILYLDADNARRILKQLEVSEESSESD